MKDADEFYAAVIPPALSADEKNVMRQAFAGMLWSKQFYNYDVRRWLDGDPPQPPPPAERRQGRNSDWTHVFTADVLSMPDTWEFPWYAAWDLAFHCVARPRRRAVRQGPARADAARVVHAPERPDPGVRVELRRREPAGPRLGGAARLPDRAPRTGKGDRAFLERVFHKLLLNFDWWVNRKDALGNNIFQGGFLGLDNIGIFDRNARCPTGVILGQADGTSWMAMYCLNLLGIALELAIEDPAYEDVALQVLGALRLHRPRHPATAAEDGSSLWDEEDGFFYDVIRLPTARSSPIRVRSLVGLIPLFDRGRRTATSSTGFPGFKRRMEWFLEHRPDLTGRRLA